MPGTDQLGIQTWGRVPTRLTPALGRDLLRRRAIEPAIGHMKTDSRLVRCGLKSAIGNALHAFVPAKQTSGMPI